jgi:hypothetical protein
LKGGALALREPANGSIHPPLVDQRSDQKMPKLEAKIAAAELKLKQMKTQQRQVEARKRSLAAKNHRSQELRRKILAGAIVLTKVESGEMDRAQFRHWLDQSITRADDRELFELPIRDAE